MYLYLIFVFIGALFILYCAFKKFYPAPVPLPPRVEEQQLLRTDDEEARITETNRKQSINEKRLSKVSFPLSENKIHQDDQVKLNQESDFPDDKFELAQSSPFPISGKTQISENIQVSPSKAIMNSENPSRFNQKLKIVEELTTEPQFTTSDSKEYDNIPVLLEDLQAPTSNESDPQEKIQEHMSPGSEIEESQFVNSSLPNSVDQVVYSTYEVSKSIEKEVLRHELAIQLEDKPDLVIRRREIHPDLKFGFVLEGLLTEEECQTLINETENIGYSKWTEDQSRLMFRDCDTIEIFDFQLAEGLWNRIKKMMTPDELDCVISAETDTIRHQRDLEGRWIGDGTVNCILFSRYSEGGHFAVHTDGFNIENFDRRSLFSIVIYLNEVPVGDGGETVFFSSDAKEKLKRDSVGRIIGDPAFIIAKERPIAGSATFFFHNVLHQSEPIRIGSQSKKYIIRSDIMYSRTPPLMTEKNDLEAFEMFQKAESLSDENPEESARLFRLAFKKSVILSRVYGM